MAGRARLPVRSAERYAPPTLMPGLAFLMPLATSSLVHIRPSGRRCDWNSALMRSARFASADLAS
ncbi:Uncharacterised protein [Mycobacteroides abscessus subsp. abscessus]|nr:Uncharacterised protein [Mycobacteroides abscessus subsp. abscessus]